MAEWSILGRFTIVTHATVDAASENEAKKKFDSGEFDLDFTTGSIVDWEKQGKPEEMS